MTHVTSGSVIPVTRARVTPISRYPVTCVTEGLKRPRYRHERDNERNLQALGADGSGSVASPSECDALPAGAVQITVSGLDNLLWQRITALAFGRLHVPCASHPSGVQAQTAAKPLQHSERPDHRHLFDGHRKGIYAGGVPHSLTFLGLSAGQVLGATEALAKRRGKFARIDLGPLRDRGGWGKNKRSADISTSSSNFAALFQKPVSLPPQRPVPIFWRGSPENIQMTMNDGALIETQASESNGPTIASDLRRNET